MSSKACPPGWELVTLSDLGEVNRGRSRHRPRYAEHLYGGPYPFIQTGDIKQSQGRITSYTQTYSEAGLQQSRLWPKGTMCITIAANIAETGILSFPACFPDSVVGFIPNTDKCNVYFIEYMFRYLKQQIQWQASGSVQDNINLATFERLQFPLPSLEVQNAIAHILGTLDDKIELNRKMNETLEMMARALFKSWFIDFDPVRAKMDGRWKKGQSLPGLPAELWDLFPSDLEFNEFGEIPKGWRLAQLGDVAHFQNGYAFKSSEMISDSRLGKPIFKMGNIKRGGGFNPNGSDDFYPHDKCIGLERFLLKKGDLLMSMTDMKNNVALLGHTALMPDSDVYLVNQRVGLIRAIDPETAGFSFLYCLTNTNPFLDALRSRANSGVQVNLSSDGIKSSLFVLPSQSIHRVFDRVTTDFFQSMMDKEHEVQILSNARDALLPKLISGEMKIQETEQFLKERGI